jgi:hypothetical protein
MTECIDERAVFEKILKFDEFRRFCENEWKPRAEQGASIDWAIDSTLEHYALQDCDVTTGKPFVVLQHLPETLDDAFLVAHEMVHVIIALDNQCLQIKINNVIAQNYEANAILDMARRLGSMLDDPRVDSFLMHKYGFNPSHFYAKVKLSGAIKGLTPSSEGKFDLIRWNQAMFYSQTKSQCDLVKDDEEVAQKWEELENLYHLNRPSVERIGGELYSMAKETGYDTPEEQKILFQKIVDNYKIDGYSLSDILSIT